MVIAHDVVMITINSEVGLMTRHANVSLSELIRCYWGVIGGKGYLVGNGRGVARVCWTIQSKEDSAQMT